MNNLTILPLKSYTLVLNKNVLLCNIGTKKTWENFVVIPLSGLRIAMYKDIQLSLPTSMRIICSYAESHSRLSDIPSQYTFHGRFVAIPSCTGSKLRSLIVEDNVWKRLFLQTLGFVNWLLNAHYSHSSFHRCNDSPTWRW